MRHTLHGVALSATRISGGHRAPCAHRAAPAAGVALPRWRAAAVLALAATLAGCGVSGVWDQEHVCQGRERTENAFVSPADGPASHKDYALTVDFHIRRDQVLVKSMATHIDSISDQAVTFSMQGPQVALQGHYDQVQRALVLTEDRELDTPLGRQRMRTTGTFQCRPV